MFISKPTYNFLSVTTLHNPVLSAWVTKELLKMDFQEYSI